MTFHLPTLAEMRQKPRAVPKQASRLQDKVAVKKSRAAQERVFKATVFARDEGRCRRCGSKVLKTMARDPKRAEIHHIHGRVGPLRYQDKCALLLDLACHELVTGKVAERWAIAGTTWFLFHGQRVIDARQPVTFRRIA